MKIKRIAVMGAGAMGHGIAQVAAVSGLDVNLKEE
jgi:3-hydroxyacyl-CoA dehydrogenase